MKTLILISAIALSGMFYNSANAQIRVHLGVNFGVPGAYAPARVVVSEPAPVVYNEPVTYSSDDDYYYLPDADAYYSVNDQCYFYNNDGAWVSAAYLPGAYRDYDWRSIRHYEVRAPRPYLNDDFYRNRFNGAAFNGQWNRGYDRDNRGYINSYRDDNRRVDEGNREFNRGEQHYSQNNFRGRERDGRGDFRHGRS